MAEKNSLWKNIRNKAKKNRETGATPKQPTAEMLRQERKIRAKKAEGGTVGENENDIPYRPLSMPMEGYEWENRPITKSIYDNPKSKKEVKSNSIPVNKQGLPYKNLREYEVSASALPKDYSEPRYVAERSTTATKNTPGMSTSGKEASNLYTQDYLKDTAQNIKVGLDIGQLTPAAPIAYGLSLPFTAYDVASDLYSGQYNRAGIDALGFIPGANATRRVRNTLNSADLLNDIAGDEIDYENLTNNPKQKAEGGYMYPDGGKTGPGKGLSYIPPTMQDSLDIYNNSLAQDKYYGNKYKKTSYKDSYSLDNYFSDQKNVEKGIISKYKKNPKLFVDWNKTTNPNSSDVYKGLTKIFKTSSPYKSWVPDLIPGVAYYNSPGSLVDSRIKPQEKVLADSFSDAVEYYRYDPLAVKPYSMLTEKEKIQRFDKYGSVGFPKNWKKSKSSNSPINKSGNNSGSKSGNTSNTSNTSIVNRDSVQIDRLDPLKLTNIPVEETPLELNLSNTKYKEPFKPSRVVLREMGNIRKYNNNEPYKATHEVYVDDGNQWRPVSNEEYETYKKQYPGSDEPLGWTGKKEHAAGGYYPTQGPPKALFKGYAEGGEDERKKRELAKRNDNTDAVTRETSQGLGLLAQSSEDLDNAVAPYVPTSNLAKQYYYNNYSPVEYPNPINAAIPVLKTAWNLINPATSIGREQLKAKLTSLSTPNRPIGLDKEGNPNIGEEAWKKALGLPTKEKYIVKSQYKPSNASDPNAEYYTINPNVIDKQKIIDYVKSEDFMKRSSEGKSPNSRVTNMDTFSDFVQDDFIAKEGYKQGIEDYYQIDPIQKFQISKAWDPEKKKWYASIYDKYDFDSESANKAIKPYEIYDRVYFDSNEKPIKQSTASKVTQAYGNPFANKKSEGGYTMKNNNKSWREYLQYAQGGYTNPYNPYHKDPHYQYSNGGVFDNLANSALPKEGATTGQALGQFAALQQLEDTAYDTANQFTTNMATNKLGADKAAIINQGYDKYKNIPIFGKKIGMAVQMLDLVRGKTKERLEDYDEKQRWQKQEQEEQQRKLTLAQPTINQNISFSAQGGIIANNSLNLPNTMRNKRFAQGGTLEQQGINFITEKAGLHYQNANGGVPIGPDALAEGGEAKLQMADGGQYIVSGEVNGANTQSINGETMTQRLKKKLKPFMMGGLASNPRDKDALRRPFDSYSAESIAQVKDNAIQETEAVRMQRGGALQYAANGGKLNKDIEKIVMEEYTAAYGGTLPNKYKGKVNMPNSYAKGGIHIKESKKGTFTAAATKHGKSVQEFAQQVLANKENYSPGMVKKANFARNPSKWNHADGGYVHNQMIQPMLAEGGPIYGDPASEYVYAQGGMYGDPYARGGQIDYTNDMYSSYASGGPMVGNAPQAFKGPAAQNRGGMLMTYADGGMMPQEQQMQQQGGQDQMMQMVQQIAQAIMQGANPEQLMAELEGSGMPPKQIQQVMQAAMQIVDQQQQQQPQGQPMQEEQQMPPQQGMSTGGRLPKDILRARAEAHMSPEKAAAYVDKYAMGGYKYAESGPVIDPTKLKAEGYVEYDEYFYNPKTGQYVDKPSKNSPETDALYQKNLEKFMQPGIQFDERTIKPLLGLVNNTGIEQMPIDLGLTTSVGGIKKPGMENVIGDESYIEGTRYTQPNLRYNSSTKDYSGKYNLQYVDPYTLGGNEMMDQRYPILDRNDNIQLTPENFNNLQTVGARSDIRSKYFKSQYDNIKSIKDRANQAYQSNFSGINPTGVDDRGNYIFNQPTPVQNNTVNQPVTPLKPINEVSTMPPNLKITPNEYNGELDAIENTAPVANSYNLNSPEFDLFNRMRKTKEEAAGTPTIPENYNGPIVQPTIPRVNAGANAEPLEFLQSKKALPLTDNSLPELVPMDTSLPEDVVKKPGGSEGMSAADWGTMIGQLAGPVSQFFQKKPEPFKYQKAKPTTLDPTTAIILANQASREAQALADYNIKQNAPTSGSYLANIRANALQSGLGRGRTGAGITQQYDINNAGILNQFEQYNTELENRAIDAMQQDEANFQEQRTNALYNAGANMAGMRRDYKANQINEMIAKNLGTNNWEYDQATDTFKFRNPNGQIITVPAATVLGTNPTNLGTGEMQQKGTPQFQSNFEYKTNQAFRDRFKGSNSGK